MTYFTVFEISLEHISEIIYFIQANHLEGEHITDEVLHCRFWDDKDSFPPINVSDQKLKMEIC